MELFVLFHFTYLLLIYRKKIFLFIDLVSYNLIQLAYSSRFRVGFLELSMYRIMSPASKYNFTSSFAIYMPLISFSCLIALVRIFSTVLNSNEESRHPCLVPNCRSKSSSVSLLSMLAVSVILLYVPVKF